MRKLLRTINRWAARVVLVTVLCLFALMVAGTVYSAACRLMQPGEPRIAGEALAFFAVCIGTVYWAAISSGWFPKDRY